jgi:hypothetical protein
MYVQFIFDLGLLLISEYDVIRVEPPVEAAIDSAKKQAIKERRGTEGSSPIGESMLAYFKTLKNLGDWGNAPFRYDESMTDKMNSNSQVSK